MAVCFRTGCLRIERTVRCSSSHSSTSRLAPALNLELAVTHPEMPRFCNLGVILLAIAFVLSFLVSISAPYISVFDLTRTTFSGTITGSSEAVDQFRLGIWGYCQRRAQGGNVLCERTGHGYEFRVVGADGHVEYLTSKWTRGLAVQPVATAVIFVALLLSFSTSLGVLLAASLMSFLGAVMTIIALGITIALYLYQRGKMNNFGVPENTDFGPGFWMNLAALVLTLIAAFIVCFGRRRESMVRKSDNYVPSTGYNRPTGWRRFIPGRRY